MTIKRTGDLGNMVMVSENSLGKLVIKTMSWTFHLEETALTEA